MLPSFRLIVVTFLFSFVLVFASLRLVDSARLAQEPLSVPLAVLPPGGVPMQFASIADRRGNEDVPAMFNMRFAAGTGAISPIPASLTLHALGRAQEHNTRSGAESLAEPAPVPLVTVEPLGAPAADAVDGPASPPAQNSSESEAIAPLAALPEPATLPAPEPSVATAPEPVAPAPPVESRLETAALPEPTTPPVEGSGKVEPDVTASIDPDRRPPVAVPTAGTTRPAAAPVRRAKPKPASPGQKAIQARAARPKPAAARTTAPAAATPLQSLFGSATQ